MKSLATAALFALASSAPALADCPNLAGTYVSAAGNRLTVEQNACQEVKFTLRKESPSPIVSISWTVRPEQPTQFSDQEGATAIAAEAWVYEFGKPTILRTMSLLVAEASIQVLNRAEYRLDEASGRLDVSRYFSLSGRNDESFVRESR